MTDRAVTVTAPGCTSGPGSARPFTADQYATDVRSHRARVAGTRITETDPDRTPDGWAAAVADHFAALEAENAARAARLALFGFRSVDTPDGRHEMRRTVFLAALQTVARRTAAHRANLERVAALRPVDLGRAALTYGLELIDGRTDDDDGSPVPELVRCHRPITAHGPPPTVTSESRSTCPARSTGRAWATRGPVRGPVHPVRGPGGWPARPNRSPGRPPP